MVTVDHAEPTGIVDPLLWHDAQVMLGRHAEPDQDGNCVWCGWQWPCTPRRLAERAETASRRPWQEAWTLRHDLNSIRAMPGMRVGLGNDPQGGRGTGPTGGNRSARHAATERQRPADRPAPATN